jgi:hypothetical protein
MNREKGCKAGEGTSALHPFFFMGSRFKKNFWREDNEKFVNAYKNVRNSIAIQR